MSSRIELPPDHGEEVIPAARKNFTKAQRRAVGARQEGRCTKCSRPIADIDHIVPLELGGAHTLDNFQGLCKPHHQIKTVDDAKAIAKARRIRKRRDGTRRPRQKIPSRPFQRRHKE